MKRKYGVIESENRFSANYFRRDSVSPDSLEAVSAGTNWGPDILKPFESVHTVLHGKSFLVLLSALVKVTISLLGRENLSICVTRALFSTFPGLGVR